MLHKVANEETGKLKVTLTFATSEGSKSVVVSSEKGMGTITIDGDMKGCYSEQASREITSALIAASEWSTIDHAFFKPIN